MDGHLLAMEVATGRLAWQHELAVKDAVEMAIHEGRVYATSGGSVLSCFDYRTGTPIFEKQVPGVYRGRPTMLIQDGRLFLGSGGEVACFDLDGNVIWHEGLVGRGIGNVALGVPGQVRPADESGR